MLNVRASIVILTGVSLFLSACGGGAAGKRTPIRKGDRGGMNSWIKETEIREEQVIATETAPGKGGTQTVTNRKSFCLSLPKLSAKLQARDSKDESAKREMIAIYTYDLDFVEVDVEGRRLRVPDVTDQLKKQKRHFFFGLNPRLMQVETVPAQALTSAGATLGQELFAVEKQDGCKTVTFGNQKVYEILPGYTARRLMIRNSSEVRVYERDGQGQFRVSIVKGRVTPGCSPGDRLHQQVKEEYMVARSRDLNRITIGRNLGILMNESFKEPVPELQQQLTKGGNRRLGTSRIYLSAHTYEVFSEFIRKGQTEKVPNCSARP